MGIKSYFANSLRMAIEVSKASLIKKKLITKYHKFYFHIDFGKDRKQVSKFHRQDHINEELFIEENVIYQFLDRPDCQIKDEVNKEPNIISLRDTKKADIEDLPLGSIVTRIIIKKGLIVEKTYQTPTGSYVLVSF